MKGDSDAAVNFLRRWASDGWWVLTAISPDKKSVETVSVQAGNADEAKKWIGRYNGKRNIYFTVNPVLAATSNHPEKEHIAELAWLHVDVDPRARVRDMAKEQERLLGLLTNNLPETLPKPTLIIFSGGGYQGFWKLKIPMDVDGDEELIVQAERYNRQIEQLLDADNCHNINRIMRLPGTVNLPDAKKRAKGRVAAVAEVVEFYEHRVYDLEEFQQAAEVQSGDLTADGPTSTTIPVEVGDDVPVVEDIDALDEWNVPERVKIVAVQGEYPDEAKPGDNSRSVWLFDFVCQCVRFNVPDEVIYSILMDPGFGISESVVELGSKARKYALRQIQRAKEEVEEPWLRVLNDRHFVIENLGGRCVVGEEVVDEALNRPKLTFQSFDAFGNRYLNKRVEIGVDGKGNLKTMPVGKWWLQHANRRQYSRLAFSPGHEVPGAYNMWTGFAVSSAPGDCDLFLDHVHDNVCGGNATYSDYVINWMARGVQKPNTPGEVAIVLRGGRGVGKSLFATEFGALFGRHFMQVVNASHLVGNFNNHIRDLVVLFADEAFYAGDKKHASVLKGIVTEETLTIEAKGVDAETAPNYVHLIMASNDQHVVPAGSDERRYFVLDVGDAQQQNTDYFGSMIEQMRNGGREALLHFLMSRDISKFDVRRVPITTALMDQKLLSLSTEEEWWYGKLVDGRLSVRHDEWRRQVPKDDLRNDYIHYTDSFRMNRRGNETIFGKFLSRVAPGVTIGQRRMTVEVQGRDGHFYEKKARVRIYVMPSLQRCREHWDSLYGSVDWTDPPELDLEPPKDPF